MKATTALALNLASLLLGTRVIAVSLQSGTASAHQQRQPAFSPRHDSSSAAVSTLSSGPILRKRAECGAGIGSCSPGSCCSEGGWCGSGPEYCGGSACQLEYSDSCDTFFPPEGKSTENVPRPKIGNVPYGTIITSCTVPGTMALTYDDGPLSYTEQLLDILDEYGIKVTFFIAGNNRGKGSIDNGSKPWPGLLRRIYNSGHHIASHTWTHRDLNTVNDTIQRTEIIYNEMAFRNLFGWVPTYMRPPYLECDGSCLDLMSSLGYHVIEVNVDTKDYEFDAPELIQKSKDRFSAAVSPNGQGNYITLAHDVHYQTVVNLTAFMIETSRQRGYKLVTVGECLGDPRENWYRPAAQEPGRSTTLTTSTTTRTSSTSTARPSPTDQLKISPDQSCGGSTGYTCQGSGFGNCCSWYGFCGRGDSYCGTGCDQDFGTCNSRSRETTDTTNGLCGVNFDATCINYGDKKCCSVSGYCGNSASHCGGGCQEGFGICN